MVIFEFDILSFIHKSHDRAEEYSRAVYTNKYNKSMRYENETFKKNMKKKDGRPIIKAKNAV